MAFATEDAAFHLVEFAGDDGARVVIVDHGDGDDWVKVTPPEFFAMARNDALDGLSDALGELLAIPRPAPELDVEIDESALELAL